MRVQSLARLQLHHLKKCNAMHTCRTHPHTPTHKHTHIHTHVMHHSNTHTRTHTHAHTHMLHSPKRVLVCACHLWANGLYHINCKACCASHGAQALVDELDLCVHRRLAYAINLLVRSVSISRRAVPRMERRRSLMNLTYACTDVWHMPLIC